MRLDHNDIRELNLLKYWRVIRKWTSRQYGITEPEVELLVQLDCLGRFFYDDYVNATYLMSWNKKRWGKLKELGFISVWRKGQKGRVGYKTIYATTVMCRKMVNRMYDVALGKEDIPLDRRSAIYHNKSYTEKVINKVLNDMNQDETRNKEYDKD